MIFSEEVRIFGIPRRRVSKHTLHSTKGPELASNMIILNVHCMFIPLLLMFIIWVWRIQIDNTVLGVLTELPDSVFLSTVCSSRIELIWKIEHQQEQ